RESVWVSASRDPQPDSSLRDHCAREHAQRQRTRGPVAQFPGSARVYARSFLVERVALPKTAQLGQAERRGAILMKRPAKAALRSVCAAAWTLTILQMAVAQLGSSG